MKEKVSKHNKKYGKDKVKKLLGMLKAVYRRGAGAFSSTHRPGMSRSGWGVARVNAFLKLVRSGRPSNPKYKQDNDLLPAGHPRKSSNKSRGFIMELDNNTEAVAEDVVETEEVETDSQELEPTEVSEDDSSAEDDSDLLVEAHEPTEEEQAAHDASLDDSSEEVLEDSSEEEVQEDSLDFDWDIFDLALTAAMQDAALTTKQRNELPDSAFCGPDRSFPVPDCAHVTAARRLIGRAKLSESQKDKVLACVNKKADSMSCDIEKDQELSEIQKDYSEALAKIQSLEEKLESAIQVIAKYENKEFSFEKDANRLEVLVTYFDSICSEDDNKAKSVVVVENPSVDSSDVVTASKAMTKLGGFEKTVVDNYNLIIERDGLNAAESYLSSLCSLPASWLPSFQIIIKIF